MIMAKLKEATREQHENLETLVDVMNKMFTRQDYELLLTKFYKFYSSIEPRVAENRLVDSGLDFDSRLKTPSLERDLRKLGIFENVKHLAGSWTDLPVLDTAGKAFGSCYVMEGATLGGQIIMRHLKQNLDLTPENGGSFFNSYGENVGPMWKQFCAVTTEFAARNENDDEIVNSARDTFDSFARCFSETAVAGI